MSIAGTNAITELWAKCKAYFQAKLVSGTNIKTINNESLLGSGNISISGDGSGNYLPITGGTLTGPLTIDDANSATGQISFADVQGDIAFNNTTDILATPELSILGTTYPRYIDMRARYNSDDTVPAYSGISAFSGSNTEASHVRARTDEIIDVKGVLGVTPVNNSIIKVTCDNIDTSQANNGVSETVWRNIGWRDSADRFFTYIQSGVYANGTIVTEFATRNLVNGSNVNNVISLRVSKDGTRSVVVSDDAAWRTALGLGAVATYANGSALINSLGTGTSAPVDADYYVCQYAGGGTSNTTYVRRPMSSLWNYIKSKIDSVYGIGTTAKGAGQSELASAKAATSVATATTVNLDTIVLAPGTWLVTYSAEFASNATGRRVMTLTTNATSIASTPVYMMSTAAANGLATNLSRSQVIVNSGTSNVTRYLNVYQNSGSSLNCRSCIQAVRIA